MAASIASFGAVAASGLVLLALALAGLPQADATEITGSVHAEEASSGAAAASAAVEPASAAGRCLSRQEQRARIAAKTVVPLAKAARAVKGRGGDLLRARLCERDGRLVYLLTVLGRGGKVLRVAVDAGSGAPINGAR
jgi:uncharacterized membrane protein YkoI